MTSEKTEYINSRVLLGVGVVVIGVLMFLPSLSIDVHLSFGELWPLFLMIFGAGQLMKPEPYRQTLNGSLMLAIGFIILGNNLDWFDFDFGSLWPVLFIVIGILMIRRTTHSSQQDDDKEFIKLNFVLNGGERIFSESAFKGGSLAGIMGGGKVDLRHAQMVGDFCILDVFVIWGGYEIWVPSNWTIEVHAMPILGGVDNKTNTTDGSGQKRLIIKGTVVMGGIEIKN